MIKGKFLIMWKLFGKKTDFSNIDINSGNIIKIHEEIHNTSIPNISLYNITNSSEYINEKFVCLKSYDNIVIFIIQDVFNQRGYSIFGKCALQDPRDKNYFINISKIIKDYCIYRNTISKSSETIVPTYIDICKIYTCNIDGILVCISITDHLQKSDDLYRELAQLKQIKERLHV